MQRNAVRRFMPYMLHSRWNIGAWDITHISHIYIPLGSVVEYDNISGIKVRKYAVDDAGYIAQGMIFIGILGPKSHEIPEETMLRRIEVFHGRYKNSQWWNGHFYLRAELLCSYGENT